MYALLVALSTSRFFPVRALDDRNQNLLCSIFSSYLCQNTPPPPPTPPKKKKKKKKTFFLHYSFGYGLYIILWLFSFFYHLFALNILRKLYLMLYLFISHNSASTKMHYLCIPRACSKTLKKPPTHNIIHNKLFPPTSFPKESPQ